MFRRVIGTGCSNLFVTVHGKFTDAGGQRLGSCNSLPPNMVFTQVRKLQGVVDLNASQETFFVLPGMKLPHVLKLRDDMEEQASESSRQHEKMYITQRCLATETKKNIPTNSGDVLGHNLG